MNTFSKTKTDTHRYSLSLTTLFALLIIVFAQSCKDPDILIDKKEPVTPKPITVIINESDAQVEYTQGKPFKTEGVLLPSQFIPGTDSTQRLKLSLDTTNKPYRMSINGEMIVVPRGGSRRPVLHKILFRIDSLLLDGLSDSDFRGNQSVLCILRIESPAIHFDTIPIFTHTNNLFLIQNRISYFGERKGRLNLSLFMNEPPPNKFSLKNIGFALNGEIRFRY